MGSSRTVRIDQVEQPDDQRASVYVETISESVTEAATAVVEIGLGWDGDAAVLEFNNTVPLELPRRCSRPETGLLLLPSDHGYERRSDEPDCWKPNLTENEELGHALGLLSREVENGDMLSCRAEVWGDHRSENCLEPGEYSFDGTLSVENEGHEEWGFTIRIEK